MSDTPLQLPARPSLEQLRKLAKQRLATLRTDHPALKLADAQHALAREYGFPSWPKLIQHVTAQQSAESAPTITAPVSRQLGVLDVKRTTDFWCNVLGFSIEERTPENGAVTLVSGQARIQLHRHELAVQPSGDTKSPNTALVFLPVSDIAAMHALVTSRGGSVSAMEKVNWLKLQLFQVHDPDGHVVWFGQSYHRDMLDRPARMFTKALPEIACTDVAVAVRHYRDVLGFSVNYEQDDIAVVDRDSARLLLIARGGLQSGVGSAFFYVREADALYAELLRTGADIQSEPVSRPWGIREFAVHDPDGNRLTFGQTFE